MIVKLEMQIPEHDRYGVQERAMNERLQNLKDLAESYGYGNTASLHAEGIWLDPGAIEGQPVGPNTKRNEEIQMAVGGLVLELMALEKYWNRKGAFRSIERELDAPSDATPWELLEH